MASSRSPKPFLAPSPPLQILECLVTLRSASMIHCDLKPENILLVAPTDTECRVIDFGSACFEGRTIYSYIQSRFYRSPEIILGHPYNSMVDMWSLGCIAAELYLGLPLFPGASHYDMLARIGGYIGTPSHKFLSRCKVAGQFYVAAAAPMNSQLRFQLMSPSEFCARHGAAPEIGKQYFKHLGGLQPEAVTLDDVILRLPQSGGLAAAAEEENARRYCFLDFLKVCSSSCVRSF
jgi:dual specificity protein kinase YAK1